ncbi:hypothetical protein N1851_030987 [Merluccius polli]|uniref:Transposase Helix-turn-helix domain-containing protein n=1 Tax=Merluccius polli TaxID=89951 RepID=A0AA47M4I4_MERPO|nr:hypothetical protein N1851_030987 [Merluccius polli]
MVKQCAYGICKSDSRYPKSLAGGVVFFPFPKPKTGAVPTMDQAVWKAPLPAKCHENKQAYIRLLQALMMQKRLNSILLTVSPEQPPLPGCQLEREPEGEQSTEKEEIRRRKQHEIEIFTYDRFNQLCTIFGIPNDPHTTQINVPLNYKRNDWQVAEMPLRSQLLFVLMKLRNNEDLKKLAFRCNINMKTASNIFNSWIHYMFDVLGELPIWPHRDVITQNMPETYKAAYP